MIYCDVLYIYIGQPPEPGAVPEREVGREGLLGRRAEAPPRSEGLVRGGGPRRADEEAQYAML